MSAINDAPYSGAPKPSDGLIIAALEERHLDEILAIERESFPSPWPRQAFADELRLGDVSLGLVALAGPHLVGYGLGRLLVEELHVTNLAVDSAARGRGIGRRLLSALLAAGRERGARQALLEVRFSNQVARQLYRSLGFREIGLRKGYYQREKEDAVVMLCSLQNGE